VARQDVPRIVRYDGAIVLDRFPEERNCDVQLPRTRERNGQSIVGFSQQSAPIPVCGVKCDEALSQFEGWPIVIHSLGVASHPRQHARDLSVGRGNALDELHVLRRVVKNRTGDVEGLAIGRERVVEFQLKVRNLADAIECNIYYIPTDPKVSAADIEKTYFDILKSVKATVTIPVAIKLSPFFSNLSNMAHRLDEAGADALVLFNRFYQPDIDLEELEIRPNVLLSTPQALRLPLTWIGILFGRVKASLAATGGVHNAEDVVKLLMVGANVTMMCSSLMRHGVNHLRHVERELRDWMEEHEYESVAQMQGSMSQIKCPDPGAFERAQYMRAVKGMQHIHMAGWR